MAEQESKLDAIHHVAIQVEDIARALKWYSENLTYRQLHYSQHWEEQQQEQWKLTS